MSGNNSGRRSWGKVIEKWKDESGRQKAWRDADSSMIPEYVAPKRNFRSGTKERINKDWKQLQQQMAKRQKNIKRT